MNTGATDTNDNIESGGDDEQDKSNSVKTATKLGWFEGVYLRCLLNIWGVMLFLRYRYCTSNHQLMPVLLVRLTWVVGQAGILEGLAIVLLANIVTIITTVSMSAVSTNGQIKGGGVYYMISRSLGPEFGGAIGLMFTVANAIAVSMYIVGFCEAVRDMLVQYVSGFEGVIGGK